MIDGIPNRPLYFYQKDIIELNCIAAGWQDVSQASGAQEVVRFRAIWWCPKVVS